MMALDDDGCERTLDDKRAATTSQYFDAKCQLSLRRGTCRPVGGYFIAERRTSIR